MARFQEVWPYALPCVLCLAFFFAYYVPFGPLRSKKSVVVVAATPEEVWPLLEPDGWNVFMPSRNWSDIRLIDRGQRIWRYRQANFYGQDNYLTLYQPIYKKYEQLVQVIIAVDDLGICENQQIATIFDIEPCEKGVRITASVQTPGTSVGGAWDLRRNNRDMLAALQRYFASGAPERMVS